jgi:hypothetical protein
VRFDLNALKSSFENALYVDAGILLLEEWPTWQNCTRIHW